MPFDFDYAPGRGHAAAVPMPAEHGFRIHPVGRGEAPPSRGLRFAFVAAGAVSLAAIALGGVTTSGTPADTDTRAGSGSNVTPARSQGSGAATAPESQRRRGSTAPLLAQAAGAGQSTYAGTPVAPTTLSAPLLPGLRTPGTVQPGTAQDVARTLTTPVVAGAAAMSPLIRPLSVTTPVSLTTVSPAPAVTAPGVLSASASPSATSSP